MANDRIQSISIGLGLDLAKLETDARAAKTKLNEILPKGQERSIVLRPKIDRSAIVTLLGQIEGVRNEAQRRLDHKPFMLTPRFAVTRSAVVALQKSVNEQFKGVAEDLERGIKGRKGLPLTFDVKPGKINKAAIQADISKAIGVVPVALSWKWDKNGAPPKVFKAVVQLTYEDAGGAPGAPSSGTRPPRPPRPPRAPAPETGPEPETARPSRAERSAANKAAHAARDRTTGPTAEGATRAERTAANKKAQADRAEEQRQQREATRAANKQRSEENKAAHAAQQQADRTARETAKAAGAAAPEPPVSARPTRAERSAANKAAHAERAAATPATTRRRTSGPMAAGAPEPPPPPPPTAPATGAAGARPRGRTTPPTGGQGGAAAASTTTPGRLSMDELRRTGQPITYSAADLMAQEMEKTYGTVGEKPRTRGARGASRAAGYAAPEAARTINKPLSPAILAQREAAWAHHEALVAHYEKVTAVNARSNDPAHQRSRAIVQAMKSVKRDPVTGEPDTTEMDKLLSSRFSTSGSKLATAYGQYLGGNFQEARETIGDTLKNFGVESGVPKGRARLGKSLNPGSKAFNKQPADIQLFGEIAGSVRTESALAQNPDTVLKNRSVRSRGYGPTSYTGNVATKTMFETDEGREKFEEQLQKNQPYMPGVRAKGESEADFRARVAAEEPNEAYLARNKDEEDTGRILEEEDVNPDTGALRSRYKYVSDQDARAKATAASRAKRPTPRERSEKKAQRGTAFKQKVERGEATYNDPSKVPGFEPGQLNQAQPKHFADIPTPEGFAGAQRKSRPKQNMGAGPTPRMTADDRATSDFVRDFWSKFAGAERPSGYKARGREKVGAEPTLGEKLRAMALHGSEFGERANALDFMRTRGHGGLLSAEDRLHLASLGHDIEGLAGGGKVKTASIEGLIAPVRFSRPFGQKGMGGSSSADLKSYAWRKTRAQQIAMQPWCTNCGISRAESRYRIAEAGGSRSARMKYGLTAEHKVSRDRGGALHDFANLQTACGECNSNKGDIDFTFTNYLGGPRPFRRPKPEGRAFGGRVGVYKGGRIGGSGDFMRQMYESTGAGYVTKEPSYASSYAVDRDAAYAGNLDRAYSRGMIHEGSMPSSKLASLDQWRALGGHMGQRAAAQAALRAKGYAAVDMGMEYEVLDPRYVVNRLAGPKGPLPRAEGGGVYEVNERGEEFYKSKSGRYDQFLGPHRRLFMPPEDGEVVPHHKVGHLAEGDIRFRNLQGNRWASAANAASEAVMAGRASAVAAGGGTQRVFVVNWPSGGIGGGPAPATPRRVPTGRTAAPSAAGGGAGPAVGPAAPVFGPPFAGAGAGPMFGPFAGPGGSPGARRAGGGAGPGLGGPGVAGPGATPGAGATPGGATGYRTLSAEQRAIARLAAQTTYEGMRARIGDIRAETSEQLQLTPVRALSVSVGQIFQTAFGGRGDILRRARVANRLAGVAEGRVGSAEAARRSLDEERDRERALRLDPAATASQLSTQRLAVVDKVRAERQFRRAARIGSLEANIAAQGERKVIDEIKQQAADKTDELRRQGINRVVAPNARRIEEVQTTAAAMRAEGLETGGVATRKNRLQAQALGVTGIVGGTLAFTAAMQLAQLGMELIGKVAENAADEITGFGATAAKVTAQLSETIKAQGGHPEAALAAQFAQLGLSPAQAGQLGAAGRQATIMAGAQNAIQVRDLQRTADFVNRSGGVTPGLGTNFGNGLIPGTIFSGINATPGIAQIQGSRLQDILGPAITPGNPTSGSLMGILTRGESLFGEPPSPTINTPAEIGKAQDYLKDLLETSKRGLGLQAAGLKLVEATSQEQVDASNAAFAAAGDDAKIFGQEIARTGLVLQGAGGTAPTQQTVNTFLEGIARGQLIPNPAEAFESMRPQIAAQFAAVRQDATRAREETIPTNIAMRLRTAPPLAPGTGLVGGAIQQSTFGPATNPFAALGQNAATNIDSVTASIGRAQDISRQAAVDGEKWLNGLSTDGKAAVQAITDLGTEIANISTIQANMQAQNQGEQMNRQMELQIRQLGDVLGLAGKVGQTVRATVGYDDQGNKILGDVYVKRTLMGKLQREQMMLSREDQRIQLMQQQRQINFGLALARIGVPGESPAERAANLAYNKQVAQEQQEAHDRAEDMFSIQKQLQDEGIRLNVEDASKELQQLSQSDALTLKLQGFDAIKQDLQAAQADLQPIADTFIETMRAESKAVEDAILAAKALSPQYAEQFRDDIDSDLEYLQTKYADLLNLTETSTTSTPTSTPTSTVPGHVGEPIPPGANPYGGGQAAPGGGPTGSGGYATGKWRTGNEFARLHAGEMVLPANLASAVRANGGATMYGGGGGGVTVVNINNPTVRDDSDIDKIARQVEQVMNRRASAVGLAN